MSYSRIERSKNHSPLTIHLKLPNEYKRFLLIHCRFGRYHHKQTKYIMKKLTTLALAALMFGGIAFLTGCGEKSEAEKAVDAVEDTVEDAGEKTADAIKDATN